MTFAQRKPLPQPEAGQTLLAGREKEIGLYRLHFHRPQDNPEVRLITSIAGPGGVGKTRLLDDLEWHRSAATIYGRVDDSAGFGHDAARLLRALADALHREGEAIPTPHFDQLYKRRQELLDIALNRSRDPKQVLRYFHRPTLLGLGHLDLEQPVMAQVDVDQFADLRWSEPDLGLAFENPIGLLTQALIADLNEAVTGNQAPGGQEPEIAAVGDDGEVDAENEADEQEGVEEKASSESTKSQSPTPRLGSEQAPRDGLEEPSRPGSGQAPNYRPRHRQASAEQTLPTTDDQLPISDPQAPALTLPSGSRFQKPKTQPRRVGPISQPVDFAPSGSTQDRSPGRPISTDPPTKIVLIFDNYELIQPAVGEWLLTYLLGYDRAAIACDLRLVIAGRDDLLVTDERWQPWSDHILSLPLEPFAPAEVADFVKKNAVTIGRQEIPAEDGGVASAQPPLTPASPLPVWLNVAATVGAELPDSDRSATELLGRFSGTQKSWLTKAALIGTFDQGRLTALVDNQEGRTAFKWLVGQQSLVRPSSIPGQFVLDRTLAEHLRAEATNDLSADRQELLAYLDQNLISSRKDLQKSAPRGAWSDYHALVLEYLRHTLRAGLSDEAEQFLLMTFLEALDEHPPLMFDLLREVRDWEIGRLVLPVLGGAEGSEVDGLEGRKVEQESKGAEEQRSRGAGEQSANGEASNRTNPKLVASAVELSTIQTLKSLAEAWLSGHWERMQTPLEAVATDEKTADTTKTVAYNWWGYSYRATDQPEKALEIYDKGLALQADYRPLRIDRGLTHFDLAHFREAITDFKQALQQEQPGARAQRSMLYHTRGLAYAHLSDYVEAVEDFNQAIRLDPDNSSAYSDRGLAYAKQGNYERAIEDYDQAIELNEVDAVAHFYRGLAYADQEMWDKAIQDFDWAVSLRPAYGEAFRQRALAYTQQNELTKAIIDFDRAIALNPREPANYRQRGLVYVQQGHFEKAVNDFDRAIRLDPADRISYFNLGQAYLRQGDPGRAVRNFDRVLKDVSKGAEGDKSKEVKEQKTLAVSKEPRKDFYAQAFAQRGLAYTMPPLENYARAIEDYDRAIQLSPEEGRETLLYQRGLAYAKQGNYERAIEDYDQAIHLNPKHALTFYDRGLAYNRLAQGLRRQQRRVRRRLLIDQA